MGPLWWPGKEKKMSNKKVLSKREQTRQMTILAMFIAILAVLGLVPNGIGGTLGFIKIAPNLSATIIHIPVLIGAALLGRKMGIYLGLAFGVISNIAAFIYVEPLFQYPWVAILPRFIFGLLIYDVTVFFTRIIKNKYVGIGVSFTILTILHTVMTLTMAWTSFAMISDFTLGEAFVPWVTLLVSLNVPIAALIEAVGAGIIGAVVVIRLSKFLKNQNEELVEEVE